MISPANPEKNIRIQNIPEEMRRERRWVLWRYLKRGGKRTKVPFQTNGMPARSTNENTWFGFDAVINAYHNGDFAGIGFVLGDGWAGVDLDDCVVDGKLSHEAESLVRELDSYAEISPSGTGVKVFVTGCEPSKGERSKAMAGIGEVEVYSQGRYFTVTGQRLDIAAESVGDQATQISDLVERLVESKRTKKKPPAQSPDLRDHLKPIGTDLSDDDVLKIARGASNGAKFVALFDEGDVSAFDDDHSRGDFALCSMLVFYTGPDPDRVDRLFRRSKLFREKWDDMRGDRTYGRMTIENVIGSYDGDFYRPTCPELRLPDGTRQYREFAAEIAPLVRNRLDWFLRGGRVVEHRDGELRPIVPTEGVTKFERVAKFYSVKMVQGMPVKGPALLKEGIVKITLQSDELRKKLPEVRVVSDCPVLAETDGQLRVLCGYDSTTKTLARGDVPVETSWEDGKSHLLNLLRDYAFPSDADRARMLAALLTPALNSGRLLGTNARAPLTVVEADDSQAGKGYFCRLLAAVYGSVPATVAKTRGGVGGLDEAIARQLVSGKPFVQLDNLRGGVDSQFLESVLTESSVECRVADLGGVSIDPRGTSFLLTSNRAELTQDLANRSNIIRIVKQPEDYQFHEWSEGGLVEHVQANQSTYLGAIFAVVREWHRRGKPRARDDGGHDFRPWARCVRWIVGEMLNLGNPLEDVRDIQRRTSNSGLTWLRDVVIAVRRAGGISQEMRASDLLDICINEDVEVPGLGESDDIGEEDVRRKVLQAIGRTLKSAFGRKDRVELEGVTVDRFESEQPNDHGRRDKLYRFEVSNEMENRDVPSDLNDALDGCPL